MKLQDLAAQAQTKQVAKVMESHFGSSVAFDKLSRTQARTMLNRVRGLINEHRRQPDFHSSEQNPAYLKLVMMEQGLSAVATAPMADTKTAALQTAQVQQARRQAQDQVKQIDQQIADLQKQRAEAQKRVNQPAMEESKIARRLREASEVQQAQVVLASQDMVDQVQKMIEQVTSMQFKDLPALVDQIKNEVGIDQAQQFNADATAALAGLTQNLQGSKGQLETALGVVTGQAPAVPGETTGVELADIPAADLGAELGVEELPAPEPEEEEEEVSDLEVSLGRGKR